MSRSRPRPPARVLFIGDAWDTLDHDRDSSLHLADVALKKLGARCDWAEPGDLYFSEGELRVRTRGELRQAPAKQMLQGAREELPIRGFHSLHWRKDPPVDLQTFRTWTLLACLKKPQLFNPSRALLFWSEKFSVLRFKDWAVPSAVADDERDWKAFFDAHLGTRLIAKPVGEAASRGVTQLKPSWNDALAQLRELRKNHGAWLVLQEFAAEIETTGETRAFLIGGKIAGALNKKPASGHAIMSLDDAESQRPTLTRAKLTPEQKRRTLAIARELAKEKILLACVDFIGERVLEINVTSVGLIRWMDALDAPKTPLADSYWKAAKLSKN